MAERKLNSPLLTRIALVCALIFQAAFSSAMAASMAAAPDASQFVVICTPDGLKTVPIADLNANPHSSEHRCMCPFMATCGASCGAVADPGFQFVIYHASASRIYHPADADLPLFGNRPFRTSAPRAPPHRLL